MLDYVQGEQHSDRRFIKSDKILYFYPLAELICKIDPSSSFLLDWEAGALSHGLKSQDLCFLIQP